MPSFLACYDYGQGGVWLYVRGESPEAIRQTYPRLTVYEVPPPFWNVHYEVVARKADPESNAFWRDWLEKLKTSS
jgi:hypothetical protein